MSDSLGNKVASAAKWSTITEVASKIVAPVSGMIMARILTPEAYGAMAAISIIISFTELFTDAGFKKYIVQHEFSSDDEKEKATNVAFWTNLALSLLFWGVIIIFRNQLANVVGSPELGFPLAVACAGIPIAALSSLQTAVYQRSFDFKTLFYARLVSLIIPFAVNIPLALITRDYWALIIGNLVGSTATAIILSIKSQWKPCLFYNFSLLKMMLAFSLWLILDSILVWATEYLDMFFISRGLSEHYLGLYRVSMNIVGQILAIITAAISPVIFPALSRLQDNLPEMSTFLLKMQKYAAVIIIPLGVGIYMFRNLITSILLGDQWTEAADFIGLWGLMSAITIIFARFCSNVYPAIGKPKYSIIVQILHLVVLIPAVIISVQYGFKVFYWTRSFVRLELVLVNLIFVYVLIKQSAWKMFTNILPEILSSLIMGFVAYILLMINDNLVWGIVSCVICVGIYLGVLYMLFPKDRPILLNLYSSLTVKIRKR